MEYVRRISLPALVIVLALVWTGGCTVSRNPVTGNKRAYGYTWEQEVQMGKEADASIVAEYGVYPDQGLSTYVDSVGQAVLQYSHLRRPDAEPEWKNTPFTFRVLDSPVVNAFALPGGFVYVTRGLMAHLESEAQLAVVLGHEIGHVAGRHLSKRAATQMLGQALLLGGTIGGQVLFGDEVASSILNLGSQATQLLFLSYSRDDERESDRLGVEYAAMAGYDASRAAAFFGSLERLSEQSGQSLPTFLSTHPDPGEREQTVERLAAEYEAQYPMNHVGHARLLRSVDGIVAGPNPRQGFVSDGTFYHPDLAFLFPVPDGFQVANQASRVVLVGPEQAALVYFGVESGATSAENAAETFAAQDGVVAIQSGVGSSNGLPARFVLAETVSQDGAVTRIRAHFIDYRSTVFAFYGVASEGDYATYEPSFLQTMQGFAPLRDQSILSVQPSHIALQRVASDRRFSDLVPSDVPAGFTPEGVAIMNQLELDQIVAAGTTVKLVR